MCTWEFSDLISSLLHITKMGIEHYVFAHRNISTNSQTLLLNIVKRPSKMPNLNTIFPGLKTCRPGPAASFICKQAGRAYRAGS